MATIFIPTPLRRLTDGQPKVSVEGATIGAIIQSAEEMYPGISERVLDGEGEVKRFINIFVGEDEIRTLQGLNTPVGVNDKVSIVPAMAGG